MDVHMSPFASQICVLFETLKVGNNTLCENTGFFYYFEILKKKYNSR